MKKLQVNATTVVAFVLGVGVACATGGALIGYHNGYKQGDFDGRHEAARSAIFSLSEMMTSGIAIGQPDGTAKTVVLKPVDVVKN